MRNPTEGSKAGLLGVWSPVNCLTWNTVASGWASLRKKAKPSSAEDPDIAKLAEVVTALTHQVRQLALILDEVREELIWAVRNDKFHAAGHSSRYVASNLPTESTDEDDEYFEDEEAEFDDPGPVPPPPVRETGLPSRKDEPNLFS